MRTEEHADMASHRRAVIGNEANFWLHSTRTGFDLTHPDTPTAAPVQPRLTIQTSTAPITISPAKTALVIIDMQNFFLSEAFGRRKGAGHAAADKLQQYGIPAARKAGIRVCWVNWGLTEAEVKTMPPAVKRAFGFEAVAEDALDDTAGAAAHVFAEKANGVGVDKHGELRHQGGHLLLENGKDGRIYRGLGSSCGDVVLPSGETVDAGRLLMRDTWNAALWPPLDAALAEGRKLATRPDVWIHKNRMSALWGGTTELQQFLEAEGIQTLLLSGVNTDQCVGGTLTDAFSKGFDCVLLGDAAGTTTPAFGQECFEYNAAKTYGFLSSTEALWAAAAAMG
ncbi:putative isochorismatase hydrolase protein [Neofusicoccum parvum UCRNP2]|uniref:Phosphatidylinositol 3-/4-kinase catalytic n=2 Tax=Neofusicoccum parvum TaxID=310453 RepID=A0ACB5SE40_9PEZI|nr:putative isochorismatase hydrolase protein [Neofusicoccum parvum UCRNP2]GME36391.1 Phosphatidylinositol 3-/4-kinase catalytic [Neofusicoccum parvum]